MGEGQSLRDETVKRRIGETGKNGMGAWVHGGMGETPRHSGNHDIVVIIRNPG